MGVAQVELNTKRCDKYVETQLVMRNECGAVIPALVNWVMVRS
jgi:hypothetical protein